MTKGFADMKRGRSGSRPEDLRTDEGETIFSFFAGIRLQTKKRRHRRHRQTGQSARGERGGRSYLRDGEDTRAGSRVSIVSGGR